MQVNMCTGIITQLHTLGKTYTTAVIPHHPLSRPPPPLFYLTVLSISTDTLLLEETGLSWKERVGRLTCLISSYQLHHHLLPITLTALAVCQPELSLSVSMPVPLMTRRTV